MSVIGINLISILALACTTLLVLNGHDVGAMVAAVPSAVWVIVHAAARRRR